MSEGPFSHDALHLHMKYSGVLIILPLVAIRFEIVRDRKIGEMLKFCDTEAKTSTRNDTFNIVFLFSINLNPFPNNPWFLHVYRKSLLKTQ